jgi:hypothetical protein
MRALVAAKPCDVKSREFGHIVALLIEIPPNLTPSFFSKHMLQALTAGALISGQLETC